MARNLMIDAARAKLTRPVEVPGEDVTWVPDAQNPLDGLLTRYLLRDALLQLTPDQRRVLVALYYRDTTVAEAAAHIGIPEGTVRSRAFYALRSVREILTRPW